MAGRGPPQSALGCSKVKQVCKCAVRVLQAINGTAVYGTQSENSPQYSLKMKETFYF